MACIGPDAEKTLSQTIHTLDQGKKK